MNGSVSRLPVTCGRAFIAACARHRKGHLPNPAYAERCCSAKRLVPVRSAGVAGILLAHLLQACGFADWRMASPLVGSTAAFYGGPLSPGCSAASAVRLQNAAEVALSSFATPEKLLRHAAAYTDPALESRPPFTGFNTYT
ncbi:hypothetical protein O0L34_g3877 [Tuta absoluta]|nr:hypothetical protein O0L34_g3877 [Tuta absoluta]